MLKIVTNIGNESQGNRKEMQTTQLPTPPARSGLKSRAKYEWMNRLRRIKCIVDCLLCKPQDGKERWRAAAKFYESLKYTIRIAGITRPSATIGIGMLWSWCLLWYLWLSGDGFQVFDTLILQITTFHPSPRATLYIGFGLIFQINTLRQKLKFKNM